MYVNFFFAVKHQSIEISSNHPMLCTHRLTATPTPTSCCRHQLIDDENPPSDQAAVLDARIEDPGPNVLGLPRRVQAEHRARPNHERLFECSGPGLVRHAHV